MKKTNGSTSLHIKVLGDVFLLMALAFGAIYLTLSIHFDLKNVYPHDYFSMPEIIILGISFLVVSLISLIFILLDKKNYIPHLFVLTSLVSFAFLFYLFFVILSKMIVSTNESTFMTVKIALSFFLLLEMVIVILSSVMPILYLKKGIFNSLLHSVSYMAEAILWVVLFVMMLTRVSPVSGLLCTAFLFMRSGLYWWLLALKKSGFCIELKGNGK